MTYLTGLPLTSIQIGQTQVGDAGLLLLATIPTLTSVNASRSQITDAGVEAAMAVEGRNPSLRVSK
jgi:hypothetical protein